MDPIEMQFRLDWPGFSLEVDECLPGSGVTALFGPSGCGKTTLLRCIAGLERPRAGRLSFQGEVWQDDRTWVPTHRRPLGYVFQEASLFPHLTVAGNLRFGQRRQGGSGPAAALDQAVELLGIAPLLERKPDRLSGGERQRVGIARALAVSPRILLMDEPLAALDHQRKSEILPYLERLHDALAIPVLYVSHAPDEVARLADHLVVMDTGRVLASGPLRDILARLDLPIRLGEDAGVVLEGRVVERDAQWQLLRVDCAGSSLWVRDAGAALGRAVRVRILARDVSISLTQAQETSILNTLPATVVALGVDSHPALALVRLRIGAGEGEGEASVLARVTHRSADHLGLVPGLAVWIQIKAVALL